MRLWNNKKKFIRLHPTEVHELHNGCSYSWLSQRVWLTSSLTLGVFFLVASEGTITDPSSFTMSPLQKKQNTIFVSQFSRLYKFTYITLKSSFVFQTIMHITWSNFTCSVDFHLFMMCWFHPPKTKKQVHIKENDLRVAIQTLKCPGLATTSLQEHKSWKGPQDKRACEVFSENTS